MWVDSPVERGGGGGGGEGLNSASDQAASDQVQQLPVCGSVLPTAKDFDRMRPQIMVDKLGSRWWEVRAQLSLRKGEHAWTTEFTFTYFRPKMCNYDVCSPRLPGLSCPKSLTMSFPGRNGGPCIKQKSAALRK